MKQKSQLYHIRRPKLQQMSLFAQMARNQNWQVATHDPQFLYLADPQGCFVAEADGQIISVISALSYPNQQAHISFFIVKKEYRGQGYGQKMFKYALDYLANRNIGLDSQKFLINFYKNQGFKEYFSIVTFRHQFLPEVIQDDCIIPLEEIAFEKIIAFESKVSALHRPELLKSYINHPLNKCIGYYEEGSLKGYCAMKKCLKFYRIAPLYAEDESIALRLMKKISSYFHGEQFLISAQTINPSAIRLMEGLGMKKQYQQVKMYSKELPDVQYGQVYGIMSTDLG